MPFLHWASKSLPSPTPASLVTDSIIYPGGAGYCSPPSPSHPVTQSPSHPITQSPNRLILGDNLAVMSALLPEYEGRIHLIYTDPPFFTNRVYSARIGRGEDSRRPQDWQLAKGYADHWPDMDTYLDMLYPRLVLMHRLLAPNGTLYLHLDWHANAYARLLLDEIFGPERLLNELVWCYHGPSPIRSAFKRKHDTILVYTKSDEYTFNADAVRQPYNPNTVKTFASSPKAGFGKVPDLKRGKVPEDWWYFPVVARLHNERTGYPTQKPEALLERIILASSDPGDLVADFFCGSGTTPLVAARLQRRFIANDVIFRAVHTTRGRLVQSGVPFELDVVSDKRQSRRSSSPLVTRHSPPAICYPQLAGQTLSLNPEILPTLDYWEVDPAWDGKVFLSAVQAVRPRKNQLVASELCLPARPGLLPICVRYVTLAGQQFQIEVPHKGTKPKKQRKKIEVA
jgi:DNA modification methylase